MDIEEALLRTRAIILKGLCLFILVTAQAE